MNGQVLPFSRDATPTGRFRLDGPRIVPIRPAARPTCLRRGDAARFAAYLEARAIPAAPYAAELHPEPAAPDLWPARAIWFCAGILFPFIMGMLK